MPLLLAPMNSNLTIKHVSGDSKTRRHLESLGIVPDRTIRILDSTKMGTIILVNDMRLALDKNVAKGIIVA